MNKHKFLNQINCMHVNRFLRIFNLERLKGIKEKAPKNSLTPFSIVIEKRYSPNDKKPKKSNHLAVTNSFTPGDYTAVH